MLQIKQFTFSPVQENTYILFNEHHNAIVIDPGCYSKNEEKMLQRFIEKQDLTVKKLINTHCHLDHIFGNKFVATTYNLVPIIHKAEETMLNYAPLAAEKWGLPFEMYEGNLEFIKENDIVFLDQDELLIIEAPGHSPGHICLYNKKQNFLIGGDVLFFESIGRTDLPMCNHNDLIKNIKEKLFALPNETIVYAGHNQATTIGHEKEFNPYVK